MIVLFFTACTIDGMCRSTKLPVPQDVSLFQCMRDGQSELVKWAEEHPGYFIKRWSCRGDEEAL